MSKDSRWLGADVVRDVSGVPDHHVVIADRFAVDEAVDVRLGDAAAKSTRRAIDSVVKLVSVITENPNIAAPIGPIRRSCVETAPAFRERPAFFVFFMAIKLLSFKVATN